MRIYRARQDVVLTKVCGEYMLVATRSAQGKCPMVQHINASAALLWMSLEEGASIEDLKTVLSENYRIPHRDYEEDVINLLTALNNAGYLLEDTVEV